jgi:uncharacterized membrane protein
LSTGSLDQAGRQARDPGPQEDDVFDLINGTPVHPLVVHAVVVLLPLTILGALAMVFKPAWRLAYGHLVVACGVVSLIFIPIATSSGEALEERVGRPGEHAQMGDQLIWFALPLVLLVISLWWLERRKAAGKPAIGPSVLPTALSVLVVIASLAAGFQVYRVGDSGAQAAWSERVASSTGGSGASDGDSDGN